MSRSSFCIDDMAHADVDKLFSTAIRRSEPNVCQRPPP
jgi:hypothetical protein